MSGSRPAIVTVAVSRNVQGQKDSLSEIKGIVYKVTPMVGNPNDEGPD